MRRIIDRSQEIPGLQYGEDSFAFAARLEQSLKDGEQAHGYLKAGGLLLRVIGMEPARPEIEIESQELGSKSRPISLQAAP